MISISCGTLKVIRWFCWEWALLSNSISVESICRRASLKSESSFTVSVDNENDNSNAACGSSSIIWIFFAIAGSSDDVRMHVSTSLTKSTDELTLTYTHSTRDDIPHFKDSSTSFWIVESSLRIIIRLLPPFSCCYCYSSNCFHRACKDFEGVITKRAFSPPIREGDEFIEEIPKI